MSNPTTTPPELTPPPQYVRAQRLLELLWDESCRPSLRSLRNWQKKRIVPHIKVGALVYFDPMLVRLSLQERFGIRGGKR